MVYCSNVFVIADRIFYFGNQANKMIKLLSIVLLFLTAARLQAQQADENIRKGNEFYRQQKFEEAEKEFAKALELEPANPTVINNLASVKHRLNKPAEAKKEFEKLVSEKNDNSTR